MNRVVPDVASTGNRGSRAARLALVAGWVLMVVPGAGAGIVSLRTFILDPDLCPAAAGRVVA